MIARVPLAGDTAFAGIEEVLTTLADHDVFSTRHYTRYAIALASLAADLSDQRLAEKVDLFARWDRVGFAIGIALSNRESNARRAAISTPLRATLSARSQLVAQTAADRFDVNETTRTIRLSWLANPVNSSSASSVNAPPSEKAQHRRRVRSVGFQPTS